MSKALGVVASTSSAMGNSIDETLGIVTAITEQTRNSSKAARGANAIFASLAQILDENSSNGKKIIEIFDGLGVAMYDSQGQMLSAFDLLKGMSERWDSLDSNTQKYIATTIAGTTQLNNFLSLMNNFDHALSATETSLDSVGSATEENARYMESLEATWTSVKAKFQELAMTVIDSGLIKAVLNLAEAFLEVANNSNGLTKFLAQTTLLGGVLWGGTGLIKAMGILPNLLSGFAQAAGIATGATTALGTAASISAPHLFLIATAISAVIGLAPHVVDWFKRLTDGAYNAEQKLEGFNEQLQYNEERLKELYDIPLSDRSPHILDEIEALEKENAELKENIDLWNQKKTNEEFEDEYLSGKNVEGYYITDPGGIDIVRNPENFSEVFVQSAEEAITRLGNISEATRTEIEKLKQEGLSAREILEALGYTLSQQTLTISSEEYYTGLVSKYQDFVQSFSAGNLNTKKDVEAFSNLRAELTGLFGAMDEVEDSEIPDFLNVLQEQFSELEQTTPEIADAFYNVKDSISNLDSGLEINNLQYSQLISKYPEISAFLEETANGYKYNAEQLGSLDEYIRMNIESEDSYEGALYRAVRGMEMTESQLNRLRQVYPEIDSVIRESSGAYFVEIDALAKSAAAGNEWARSMIASQKGVTQATIEQTRARINAMISDFRAANLDPRSAEARRWGERISKLQMQLYSLEKLQGAAYKEYSVGSNISTSTGGGGGSTSKPKPEDPIKKQSEAFKEQIELMEHRLFLMEKEGKSEQSRIDYIKKIQAEIERQKKWYYSKGLNANSEYIQELEKQWWQYEEEIKELYKDQAKIYEQLFSAVVDRADEEIKALEAKKDAIKKENEELEEQIRLQEALDALARAKQNKVMIFKDGRMQYVSDVDAVSAAQKDLDEIRREEALNQQLESIDKEIDKWEQMKDQWGSITSEYKKFQDRLLIEQKLGIKLEGDNWEKRLGNLQTYVNKYNELMSKANAIGKVSGATVKPFNPSSRYAYGGSARSVPLSAYSGAQTFSLMSGGLEQTGWGMGNLSPSDLMSGAINGMRSMAETIMVQIENFNPNLPNVTNGEDFVNYLANNLWRQTFQLSKV